MMAARERYSDNNGHWVTVKSEIRSAVWQLLAQQRVARFPGTLGRIPNFVGADEAARLLRELTVWRKAQIIKVNPDAPQLPVRRAALADGKVLYMAVPRLRAEKCFVEVDPHRLGSRVLLAASIRGALKYGRLVSPREMRHPDLIVCGSVAASRDGARIGKGGGFLDLEYGLLREEGKVRELTPIISTLHPLQLVSYKIPMFPHDLPVDFIVTPKEVVATRSVYPRPRGIYWDLLRVMKINAIPILRKRLRQGGVGSRQG
jgi:5-formyltetrahydrofolate cyclo-ligase